MPIAKYRHKKMEKFIIAYCTDGLCNRLKCLISAMRFAEKYSRTLIVCWPKNKDLNCGFNDLFENNLKEIELKELKIIQNRIIQDEKYKIIHTWRLLPLPEDHLPHNFSQAPFSKPGENIDFEYNRIPQLVRDRFLTYINQIVLSQYIKDKVSNYINTHNPYDISFNVRTWAEVECGRFRYFDKKAAYETIDKTGKSNFFVSCDSQDFLDKVTNKYKDRVLYYPKRTFLGDRDSMEGIQDAFIDLLLASKSKRLILSHISTFSEMIWWFSDCKPDVEIIPLKKHFFLYTSEGSCLLGKWYWKRKF